MEPPALAAAPPAAPVRAAPGASAVLVLPVPKGTQPFTYHWSRAGAALDDRFTTSDDAGGVRLTVSAAQTGDSGIYTLQASNAAGSATSKIRLEVAAEEAPTGEDPPTFLRRLQDLTVKVGSRTRFLVEIISSTECKVTWYRNERRLLEAERVALARDGNFWCADVAAVSVDDAGRWTCTAENAGGRASCSAHLNVLVPKAYKRPEFVEELRALLTEQGTVSLECKVVGVPTPVLRWFKDSREIKAGDVFALTANAEDPTSLGTYTCEAVNCMGRAYSSSKVHVVGRASREGSARPSSSGMTPEPPPIFTKELEDAHVKVCEHLTLGCHIVVPPWPKSVVWYNKEGKVEPGERYHVIEDGVGGYLLEIPSTEWSDEGEWKCVATSAGGRVGISTCYVAMDVPKNYRKPRFMENLQAVLTEEGLVSFECKVVGFPTPVLSWFKDGQELKPGDVYQLTGTNSLGSYCCIARNCMGQASSSAELTVEDIQNQLNEEEKLQLFSKNQAPKYLQGLKSVEAKIDEPFRFTVKVAIPPEPSVLWYRDDQPVDESTRCHLEKEEKGIFNLDIQNLEFLDQAEWKCVAVNDFGHSVTSCFLKLIIPRHYKKPRFLENLQAILSEEGAVNLECKVIGVPQPVLKWYKDGEELKPGDIHRIISGQDGTCCLGTYTCEAQNCMGIAASSASLLGFDDSMKAKKKVTEEQPLQRNLSLSTIHEERTSQMYDTPVGDITLDDKGEISFSFDGKEVSVSLYETPDLTEEEALQIVEMYADQLSENVTEHNVVELPPLRFVKETSTSGNLLMEAIIIDVSPDYFAAPEEDLRTEADVEDLSIADENGIPQLSLDQEIEIGGENYLEKTMALLSEEKSDFAAKSSRRKSDSQRSADDFFSLSRDLSLSEDKHDDDTHVSESELQSFASARSSAKVKSKSSKPSGEEGQESSEPTKTILIKEEIVSKTSNNEQEIKSEQDLEVPAIKQKRERRTSRGSRRSSTSSEKSINKSREELLRLKTDLEPAPSKTLMSDEELKNTMDDISTSLTKVINDVQLIEKDIILKSELMSSAATASRSLEIISSLINPLSEIHSIADAAKESISESREVASSIFNSIPQPLKALQQSLTIIEKCIDMESDNKTLVKKTCVAFIETCGTEIQKVVADITTVCKNYISTEHKFVSEIDTVLSEMITAIKFSAETIKARNLLIEASEIKSETLTQEMKHLRDTQKAVFELKSPLNSLLRIVESAESGNILDLSKVKHSEVIMNDMSAPIQDLQTALEQIEALSVKESSSLCLNKYNTEVIETVMDSVLKLRGSFEQLSTEPNIEENENVLKKSLSLLKENLTEISHKIEAIDKSVGQFEILQSENKLDVLQKMAQILIALENNLPRLETLPLVKSHMGTFHKNLTKVLEKVIESNDSKKYQTMMEVCNTVNIINSSIKNLDSENILPLASLSNTLKIIQTNFIRNIYESELNSSIVNNISDVLVGIQEAINKAEEMSLKIDSEYIQELTSPIIDKAKVNVILEHIDLTIAAVNTIKVIEVTQEFKLALTPALENIRPILEELRRCIASVHPNGVELDEHISDISEISFAETIATPLCELNQNIIVLNQLIVENIDSIKENTEVISAIAEPLHELHTTLEILQQDVISQYGDDLTPYEVSVNMASVVQNLQSCIVMIQEQTGIEGADEMSTLEDISAIKTSADTLPSDRFVLPTAEETAIEQSLLPVNYEMATTATAQTLQTLNEHIMVLQTPEVIEALDTLSEISDYASLKSVIVGLADLHTGIEGILHPVPIEGSLDLEDMPSISKLVAIAEPMQEIQQSLSVFDSSNIPIFENILDLSAEKIQSVFQSISDLKNSLECMCAVLPAVECTKNTVEISNKVSTLREVCEQLKEIFDNSKDAPNDSLLPAEVKSLEMVVNNLIDATDVYKDIKIDHVKCVTEELYLKVMGAQEEIIQFTTQSPEKISQEAKLIQITSDVEKNIAVLEQYDFIDLSRASDITSCMSPQIAAEIDSESLSQIPVIVDDAVNILQDSYQEIPIADLMIVEDFFKTCKNEFTILRCLISKATTHKKIIRLLQEFKSLQTLINNFTTKRLELRLSDDVNECLTHFLLHADKCLRNARISLIKVVDSQLDMLIRTPITKLESITELKYEMKSKTDPAIASVVKTLNEAVEIVKYFEINLQSAIVDELSQSSQITRPKPEENALVSTIEDIAIILDAQSVYENQDDSTHKVLEKLSTCITKHHGYKEASGTGKTLIILKCLAECAVILQEVVTEKRMPLVEIIKIGEETHSLKEVLAEMLEPLQALQTELVNIQEQVLSGTEEDLPSIDISTTESIMQTMTELHKDIVLQIESDKQSLSNEDNISMIQEIDKEIHSIQDSVKSIENIQEGLITEIVKPMEEIEKSLHSVLSAENDTSSSEIASKGVSDELINHIDQYIKLIEIVEEVSAIIKVDVKETFVIAQELRENIVTLENKQQPPSEENLSSARAEQLKLAQKLQTALFVFQTQVLESADELTPTLSANAMQRIAQVTAQLQANLDMATSVLINVQELEPRAKTPASKEPSLCYFEAVTSKESVVFDIRENVGIEQIGSMDTFEEQGTMLKKLTDVSQGVVAEVVDVKDFNTSTALIHELTDIKCAEMLDTEKIQTSQIEESTTELFSNKSVLQELSTELDITPESCLESLVDSSTLETLLAVQANLVQHISEYISEETVKVINEVPNIMEPGEVESSLNTAHELLECVTAFQTNTKKGPVGEVSNQLKLEIELVQRLEVALSNLSQETLENLCELVPSDSKNAAVKVNTVVESLKTDLASLKVSHQEVLQHANQHKLKTELETTELVQNNLAEALEQPQFLTDDIVKTVVETTQTNAEHSIEFIPVELTSKAAVASALVSTESSESFTETTTMVPEIVVKSDEQATSEKSRTSWTKEEIAEEHTSLRNDESDVQISRQALEIESVGTNRPESSTEETSDDIIIIQDKHSLTTDIVADVTAVIDEVISSNVFKQELVADNLDLFVVNDEKVDQVAVASGLAIKENITDSAQVVSDITATVQPISDSHLMEPTDNVVGVEVVPQAAQTTDKPVDVSTKAAEETLTHKLNAMLSDDLLQIAFRQPIYVEEFRNAVQIAKDLQSYLKTSQISTEDELKNKLLDDLQQAQRVQQLQETISILKVQLLQNVTETSPDFNYEQQGVVNVILQLADKLSTALSSETIAQTTGFNLKNSELQDSQQSNVKMEKYEDDVIVDSSKKTIEEHKLVSSEKDRQSIEAHKDQSLLEAVDEFVDCFSELSGSSKEALVSSYLKESIETNHPGNVFTENIKPFEEFFDSATVADKIPSVESIAANVREITLLQNTKNFELGKNAVSASVAFSDSLTTAVTSEIDVSENTEVKNTDDSKTEIISVPDIKISLSGNVNLTDIIEDTTNNDIKAEKIIVLSHDVEPIYKKDSFTIDNKSDSTNQEECYEPKATKNTLSEKTPSVEIITEIVNECVAIEDIQNIPKVKDYTTSTTDSFSDSLSSAIIYEVKDNEATKIRKDSNFSDLKVAVRFDIEDPYLNVAVTSNSSNEETVRSQEDIIPELFNAKSVFVRDVVMTDQDILMTMQSEIMQPLPDDIASILKYYIEEYITSGDVLEFAQRVLSTSDQINMQDSMEIAKHLYESLKTPQLSLVNTRQELVSKFYNELCNAQRQLLSCNANEFSSINKENLAKIICITAVLKDEINELILTSNEVLLNVMDDVNEFFTDYSQERDRIFEKPETRTMSDLNGNMTNDNADLHSLITLPALEHHIGHLDKIEEPAFASNLMPTSKHIDQRTIVNEVHLDERSSLIQYIDAFITDEMNEVINKMSNITNTETLKESVAVAKKLRESVIVTDYSVSLEEASPLNDYILAEQARLIQKLQDALCVCHTEMLDNTGVIALDVTPDALAKVSKVMANLQESLTSTMEFDPNLKNLLVEKDDIEKLEEQNTMVQLENLLQTVNMEISKTPADKNNDTDDTELLKNTLDEVQTVIIKLKREYDGAASDTLNETLDDLECSVRSVQLQISEESPPELLTEACATLQLLVDNMNATQTTTPLLKSEKTEKILEICSIEAEETVNLLDVASNVDTKGNSSLENIVSNLKNMKNSLKFLRESFLVDADTVIENGVEVVQCLNELEGNIFSLEREVDTAVGITADTRDCIINAVHSVYGSISNMRSTVSSVQKRFMFENYGQPSESLLHSIKNVATISSFDNEENRHSWKMISKSLRKVLNHFEDIKFYISLDKTARLPSDAAFTKIILEELKDNIIRILVPRAKLLDSNIILEKVVELQTRVEINLKSIESDSSLQVKNKIPMFKSIATEMLTTTNFIKNLLEIQTSEETITKEQPFNLNVIQKDKSLDQELQQPTARIEEQHAESNTTILLGTLEDSYVTLGDQKSSTGDVEIKLVKENVPTTSHYVKNEVSDTIPIKETEEVLLALEKQTPIAEVTPEKSFSETVKETSAELKDTTSFDVDQSQGKITLNSEENDKQKQVIPSVISELSAIAKTDDTSDATLKISCDSELNQTEAEPTFAEGLSEEGAFSQTVMQSSQIQTVEMKTEDDIKESEINTMIEQDLVELLDKEMISTNEEKPKGMCDESIQEEQSKIQALSDEDKKDAEFKTQLEIKVHAQYKETDTCKTTTESKVEKDKAQGSKEGTDVYQNKQEEQISYEIKDNIKTVESNENETDNTKKEADSKQNAKKVCAKHELDDAEPKQEVMESETLKDEIDAFKTEQDSKLKQNLAKVENSEVKLHVEHKYNEGKILKDNVGATEDKAKTEDDYESVDKTKPLQSNPIEEKTHAKLEKDNSEHNQKLHDEERALKEETDAPQPQEDADLRQAENEIRSLNEKADADFKQKVEFKPKEDEAVTKQENNYTEQTHKPEEQDNTLKEEEPRKKPEMDNAEQNQKQREQDFTLKEEIDALQVKQEVEFKQKEQEASAPNEKTDADSKQKNKLEQKLDEDCTKQTDVPKKTQKQDEQDRILKEETDALQAKRDAEPKQKEEEASVLKVKEQADCKEKEEQKNAKVKAKKVKEKETANEVKQEAGLKQNDEKVHAKLETDEAREQAQKQKEKDRMLEDETDLLQTKRDTELIQKEEEARALKEKEDTDSKEIEKQEKSAIQVKTKKVKKEKKVEDKVKQEAEIKQQEGDACTNQEKDVAELRQRQEDQDRTLKEEVDTLQAKHDAGLKQNEEEACATKENEKQESVATQIRNENIQKEKEVTDQVQLLAELKEIEEKSRAKHVKDDAKQKKKHQEQDRILKEETDALQTKQDAELKQQKEDRALKEKVEKEAIAAQVREEKCIKEKEAADKVKQEVELKQKEEEAHLKQEKDDAEQKQKQEKQDRILKEEADALQAKQDAELKQQEEARALKEEMNKEAIAAQVRKEKVKKEKEAADKVKREAELKRKEEEARLKQEKDDAEQKQKQEEQDRILKEEADALQAKQDAELKKQEEARALKEKMEKEAIAAQVREEKVKKEKKAEDKVKQEAELKQKEEARLKQEKDATERKQKQEEQERILKEKADALQLKQEAELKQQEEARTLKEKVEKEVIAAQVREEKVKKEKEAADKVKQEAELKQKEVEARLKQEKDDAEQKQKQEEQDRILKEKADALQAKQDAELKQQEEARALKEEMKKEAIAAQVREEKVKKEKEAANKVKQEAEIKQKEEEARLKQEMDATEQKQKQEKQERILKEEADALQAKQEAEFKMQEEARALNEKVEKEAIAAQVREEKVKKEKEVAAKVKQAAELRKKEEEEEARANQEKDATEQKQKQEEQERILKEEADALQANQEAELKQQEEARALKEKMEKEAIAAQERKEKVKKEKEAEDKVKQEAELKQKEEEARLKQEKDDAEQKQKQEEQDRILKEEADALQAKQDAELKQQEEARALKEEMKKEAIAAQVREEKVKKEKEAADKVKQEAEIKQKEEEARLKQEKDAAEQKQKQEEQERILKEEADALQANLEAELKQQEEARALKEKMEKEAIAAQVREEKVKKKKEAADKVKQEAELMQKEEEARFKQEKDATERKQKQEEQERILKEESDALQAKQDAQIKQQEEEARALKEKSDADLQEKEKQENCAIKVKAKKLKKNKEVADKAKQGTEFKQNEKNRENQEKEETDTLPAKQDAEQQKEENDHTLKDKLDADLEEKEIQDARNTTIKVRKVKKEKEAADKAKREAEQDARDKQKEENTRTLEEKVDADQTNKEDQAASTEKIKESPIGKDAKVNRKTSILRTENEESFSSDELGMKNNAIEISKKTIKYTERLDKNERRDDEHIYKEDSNRKEKKENGDVNHKIRSEVSHEQHYIREYQYEPTQTGQKLEVKEKPRFVDHNHRDYTMEFARPSGYRERSFDNNKPDSITSHDYLGKNAAIFKAQTLVLESQLRSSSHLLPDHYASRTSEPPERRPEIRHRSKAHSEARTITSDKRTGLSRDSKRKPVFSTYLTDRTAVEGSRVKLTCSVLSSSEPTVTWYKNGVLLDNKLKYRTKFMDGLITMEVLNAVPSDSAEYSCTIQNENGAVNSSASLKVYPSFEASPIPPTFTRSIRDTYHLAENELVLECRIRGQPLPTITWLKDDKSISSNSRYQAYYLADGVCRLAIEHPSPEDSGKYTCKAENSVWSDQITHVVNFTGKESRLGPNIATIEKSRFNRQAMESRRPHFTNVLSDYKVVSGGTIGLQVEIRGAPTRVEWLREGCSVTEVYRNAKTFVEQGLYTLALSDVTEKESGMYTCRAWSSQCHVDMNAAITVVQPNELDGKPAIIVGRPEKDILISVGEDVNISFRVQGEPKPKVVFMKGIRDITTSQRVCKMTSDDYVKFTLKRSVVSDAGTYCILARNAYGCDRAFVTVVVRQRASSDNLISDWTYPTDDSTLTTADRKYKSVPERIPGAPSVVEGGNNWISLGWPKSEPGQSAPVLAYKVESWLLGKEGGARWVELGITPLNSFDAFNLKQGEEYHFRVTPRNRYGWGESVQTASPVGVGLAGDRPEFTESLPGQFKVLVGETANLSCSVKGTPAPEVVWMKNGHEIEDEDRRLSSSYNGFNCSLTIKDINIEDEARYSCEATNVHGRASTYARLAVVTDRSIWEADAKLKRERSADVEGDYPPQFTMRLRDRRVQATYPVRLTCQVIGSPDPRITWFKDGGEVKPDNRRCHFQDEHFHTLEIAPTTLEDGGVYEAMARNSSGAVSCRCNLVVDKGIRAYVAPEFCCGLEPLYRLTDGEELRISAVVEAYPSVGVTWYRDGVRLRPSRRAIMTLDRDGQIELALAAVTSRDAGVYSCTASNEVGRASTSGKVEVIGTNVTRTPPVFISPDEPYSKEPMFIRKPRSSEAREGDTVIIACEVVGDPKPDVYWLRDFLKPDYYRDSSHFKRMGDGPEYRFEIPHAKLDYTGAYSVVARNQHGEAKAVISLQILAKDPTSSDDAHNIRYGRVEVLPRFSKELTDLLSCDGDAVEFECRLTGHPEPHVRWFHYHELIRDSPDFETSFDDETARLKIKQVTAEDEGTYTCEAANNLGKVTSTACLVVYPPGEPNTLSQRLRRPPAFLSAASTPRSTPRSTPARSVSRTPGPETRRLCSPARTLAPSFYTYPFNKVAEEGDCVSLQCAIKGNPAPWTTWDKDGVIITPSCRITIKEKDELRVLEIDQVTIEDVGVYRITIENEFGRQEASARIEVITQKGKFYAGVRAVSPSPRKSLTYRGRRPSTPRQD